MLNKDNYQKYYSYKEGLLIVVSGPSGAGKSSICKEYANLHSDNTFLSVSETTRKCRDGETPGKDYYYISEEEFQNNTLTDYYLEYAGKYRNHYGTPKQPILAALKEGKDVILEIETQGADQIRKKFSNAITVFVLPSSLEVLEKQIRNRKTETEEQIQIRMSEIRMEVNEINKYDFVIINEYGQMNEAIEQLNDIIQSQRLSIPRILSQYK